MSLRQAQDRPHLPLFKSPTWVETNTQPEAIVISSSLTYFPTMCGRFALTILLREMLARFDSEPADFDYAPRYNIAPLSHSPVVVAESQHRRLRPMRWGLVPSWSKDESRAARMINARSETVAEKPSFRKPFRTRRCLVPASGYYEWKVLPESRPGKPVKQPMYFRVGDGEPFAFAGLWDHWKRFDGKEVASFTILTTEPNDLSEPIHDRMPVILQEKDESTWLDPTTDPDRLLELLQPYPSIEMDTYPVSKKVNSSRNDDPTLIERIN